MKPQRDGIDPEAAAERHRLRGMSGGRRLVVSSAPLRAMRSYRLLRLIAEPARDQALQRDRSSGHCQLRARRAVVLRLSHGEGLRRPEPRPAAMAPGRSTGAGPCRTCPAGLGLLAARIVRGDRRAAFEPKLWQLPVRLALPLSSSYRRKPVSRSRLALNRLPWIPAFAGMTKIGRVIPTDSRCANLRYHAPHLVHLKGAL